MKDGSGGGIRVAEPGEQAEPVFPYCQEETGCMIKQW